MKYLSILPMLLITALLWGQQIDNKRMNRDIEVAENILDALLKENEQEELREGRLKGAFPEGYSVRHSLRSAQVEGTYLDGYGVLFTIKNSFAGLPAIPQVAWNLDNFRNQANGSVGEVRINGSNQAVVISRDSLTVIRKEAFQTVVENFVGDYGHLLTQIPNNEKICLKYSTDSNMGFDLALFEAVGRNIQKRSTPGYTAVVSKQAVEDFRTGKIDRKGLLAKIEYSETESTNAPETERDLVLLNSIFNRLYQRDLSEGFFIKGQGGMERIAGLGALFSYNFTTKSQFNLYFSDKHPALIWGLSDDKDMAKARGYAAKPKPDQPQNNNQTSANADEEEPNFAAFLETFKSNVIEYGCTVRTLQAEEVLSFELTFCNECNEEWPEKVKIIAKQNLLESYRQGKISLAEAIKQLQMTTY